MPAIHRGIHVEAPARLHLGFLDMHGGLGRRFGSLGLTLESIGTQLTMRNAARNEVAGPQAKRVERLLQCLAQELGFDAPVSVTVHSAIPEHAGLGSGTQLALAVGLARSALAGKPLTARDIANVLDRGNRSGIGIGAFQGGGFLMDGGRGLQDSPPPIISRLDFPESWRVLLIFDHHGQGIHGTAETVAFSQLPPFPQSLAAELCHLAVMQILPALAEADLPTFGAGIRHVQHAVGDHFSAAQGGRFSSPRVAQALTWLESQGVSCLGQSSWGPTGFAIVPDETTARTLCQGLQATLPADTTLSLQITRGRNRGGVITPLEWNHDEAVPAGKGNVAATPLSSTLSGG
jgi:beta-ribofuranosylaminobenzene 5'-phosphate synthase